MSIAVLSCGHQMVVASARVGARTSCDVHGAVTVTGFTQPPEPKRRKLRWWQTPGCAG